MTSLAIPPPARLILLSLLVGAYWLTDLHPGHLFNEDYAVYLQQSLNLIHGRPPGDMGIVYWRDLALPLSDQSPLTYPLAVPSLYALPVAVAGLDLDAIKLFQLVIVAAGLVLTALTLLRSGFSRLEVAGAICGLAVCPEMLRSIQSIGSDLPFLAVLPVALLCIERVVGHPDRTPRAQSGVGSAVALAVVLLVAIDTRTIGVALLPAFGLTWLLRPGRRIATLGVPLAILAVLLLAQAWLVPGSDSYRFVLAYPFGVPLTVGRQLAYGLLAYYRGSVIEPAAPWALAVLMLLAMAGVVADLWTRASAAASFAVCYAALLLLLPDFNAGARYLIPLLALVGAFVVRGAQACAYVSRLRPAAGVLALVALVAVFAAASPSFPPGPITFGAHSATAREAFAAVRQDVSPGGLVAVSKHRSFHLFTGRTTIHPPGASTDPAAWLDQNGVAAIVIKHSPPQGRFGYSDCPRSPFCAAGGPLAGFKEVFRNADFLMLRRSD